MKKWILFLAAFALFICICFFSYLYLHRAEFCSQSLSNLYGTPVKVARVVVTKDFIELQNVSVYNHTQYVMQPALTISKITLKVSPLDALKSLFGRPITVRKANIEDAKFSIEMTNFDGSENNWVNLLSNMAKKVDATTPSRLYRIQTLTFHYVTADIRNKAAHKHAKHIRSVKKLTLTTSSKTPPNTPQSLIYWSTKEVLAQIATHQEHPGFTTSLTQIPGPQLHQNPFEINNKKALANFTPETLN
ncbi:MAG: hypothetical protein LLF94_11275 [Chlamydiales bacterium]|nr:hypothetical protein [Chlamydiales bacterium]